MSNNDNKSFNPLYYTTNSCTSCCEAFDSSLPADASDSQRGDHCAKECQWLCWPVIFSFDIVSCPFRGTYYCQQRFCNCYNCKKITCCKNITCCKVHPDVTVQPM